MKTHVVPGVNRSRRFINGDAGRSVSFQDESRPRAGAAVREVAALVNGKLRAIDAAPSVDQVYTVMAGIDRRLSATSVRSGFIIDTIIVIYKRGVAHFCKLHIVHCQLN